MTDYPFNLQGKQWTFDGAGRSDGELTKTGDFELSQGVAILSVEECPDEFRLEVIPAEGIGRGGVSALQVGSGIAAGAAIGSVVPIGGTVVGAVAGALATLGITGAVGVGIGTAIEKKLGVRAWELAGADMGVMWIRDDDKHALRAGKHRLSVESSGRWSCRILQPSLGQSFGALVEVFDDDDWITGEWMAESWIGGPFHSGSRPVLASIHHRGGGEFSITALSVDGTHRCSVFESEEGQFVVEDHQTVIQPGKDYMLAVTTDGEWKLKLSEGY